MRHETLASLGFTFDGNALDDRIADGFVVISSKIKAIQAKGAKRRG